jgi:hypothetical protein
VLADALNDRLAMLRTLLEVATFEGWLRPLNAAMMATWQGIPLSMEAPFRSNAAVFFFVWVLIGGWVVRVPCDAQALQRAYVRRRGAAGSGDLYGRHSRWLPDDEGESGRKASLFGRARTVDKHHVSNLSNQSPPAQ